MSRFRLEGSSPCGIRSGYRIRAPKPKYVFFNSSCLCVPVFYALYYQQSSSTYEYVDVTYPQVRVMVEQREMILVVQN